MRQGILWMIFMAVLLAAGCSKNDNSKAGEVHIGYFNNVTHAQALLMKAEGTLEEAFGDDADVTWTAFNAGPAEVEALFADEIDIGYIGPVPAITANVKSDGDVQILTGATKGGSVLIARNGSGIQSAADLSGKTVAIPQIGNTQHLCLLQLLEENGLAPVTDGGNVVVSAVKNADVANMMGRGDLDAALVPEPWGTTLLQKDGYLVLDYDEIYLDGNYDVAVVVVRREFMDKNPELVKKFLGEHNRAAEAIGSDPEASWKTINGELLQATGKSLDDQVIKEAAERIGVDTELNRESVESFAAICLKQGFIDEAPGKEQLYVSDIE